MSFEWRALSSATRSILAITKYAVKGAVSMYNIKPIKRRLASTAVRQELIHLIKIDYFEEGVLPSEDQIGSMFGVSRITVRDALSYLENLGYISRVQGRSTAINRAVSTMVGRVSQGMPFVDMIRSQGFTPSVTSGKVERLTMPPDIAKKLCTQDTQMYRVEKLFCGDGDPIIFGINFFPTTYINDAIFDYPMDETVIFRTLQEDFSFPRIARDIVCIRPAVADAYIAARLNIQEGTALLSFDVVSYDENQVPLLVNREYYHPDKMHFCEVRSVEYNFI